MSGPPRDKIVGTAEFDQSRRYRWSLTRSFTDHESDIWGRPTITWIMLNPSTTEEVPGTDDATIRRIERYSWDWGYGELWVGNLYAFRSSLPHILKQQRDPVGPNNDVMLKSLHGLSEKTVVAWGNSDLAHARAPKILDMLTRLKPVYCIGRTDDGYPRHPLYCRADAQLEIYRDASWVKKPA